MPQSSVSFSSCRPFLRALVFVLVTADPVLARDCCSLLTSNLRQGQKWRVLAYWDGAVPPALEWGFLGTITHSP